MHLRAEPDKTRKVPPVNPYSSNPERKERQGMTATDKKTAIFITALCVMCLFMTIMPYAAEKSATAIIPVSCTSKGSNESFTYTLGYTDSVHQNVRNTTVQLRDGESGKFEVVFDYADVYHFTVEQKAGTDRDTDYDRTVFEVDVYVTEDENGTLHTEVIAYKQGNREKTDTVGYVNRVHKPDNTKDRTEGGDTGSYGTTTSTRVSDTKTGDTTKIYETAALMVMALLLAVLVMARIRRSED